MVPQRKKSSMKSLKVPKKSIRAILKFNFFDSVKSHFIGLQIVTVYGLYIYLILFFFKSGQCNSHNSLTLSYNTRHKKDFTFLYHGLELKNTMQGKTFKKRPGNNQKRTKLLYLKTFLINLAL